MEGTNKSLHTRRKKKEAVNLQKTKPKLPASVGGSPVEAWVRRDSPQGQGSWKE